MTLQEAIRKNRAQNIRQWEVCQRRAEAQANRYRLQIKGIEKNPSAYLDAAEEIAFLNACAEPFDRKAAEAKVMVLMLKAQQEVSA